MPENRVMKTVCDECKNEFTVENKDLITRDTGEGIQEIGFHCSECNEFYLVAKTNPAIRKLKKQIDELRTHIEQLRRTNNPYVHQLKEYQKLTKRHKALMDRLNGK